MPLAQGADEILYPGEREARNDIASRRERLTLPDETRADLRRVAERYAIQTALPFD